MYVRTIKRQNKDGSVVEYVQLAHNVRHAKKGYAQAQVFTPSDAVTNST